MQEFQEGPWVLRKPGLEIYSFEGIEITADVANASIRIRVPHEALSKEGLLEVLSSRGLIEIADRIAYHLRPR